MRVARVESIAYPHIAGGGIDVAGAEDTFTKLNVWTLTDHRLVRAPRVCECVKGGNPSHQFHIPKRLVN